MKRLALILLASGLFLSINANAQSLLTCTSQGDGSDLLRTVNPNTAATVDQVTLSVPGASIQGCNGLATHPQTQELYGILRLAGEPSTRVLATINTETGVSSVVGELSTGFAGIAFDCDAQLYGITGDGGNPSETMFKLDSGNADETFFMTLGMGDDGETLGFNPTNGLMYHASGHSGECTGDDDGVCFESIDLTIPSATAIDISSTALIDEEAQALTWWEDQNAFLWKQYHGSPGPLFKVSANGSSVTNLGDLDHQAKGMAFVPVNFPPECKAETPKVPTTNRTGLAILIMLLGLLGAGFISIRRLAN
jgi:hypothetical protein